MNTAEIKQKLTDLKHQMYVAKREGQMLRVELRTHLLRQQASEALAAGLLTEADIESVRAKWEAFKQEVASLKAGSAASTKEARAACTAAWNDLRVSLREARVKAGLAKAK